MRKYFFLFLLLGSTALQVSCGKQIMGTITVKRPAPTPPPDTTSTTPNPVAGFGVLISGEYSSSGPVSIFPALGEPFEPQVQTSGAVTLRSGVVGVIDP